MATGEIQPIFSVVDNDNGSLTLVGDQFIDGAGSVTIVDDLSDWQIELDGGVVIGEGTPYVVTEFDDGGIPERVTQDVPMPGEDGQRFGVDSIGGRTLQFTVGANTCDRAESLDLTDRFIGDWLGDGVRRQPGAVMPLRIRRAGRETLCLFGRPRNAAPSYAQMYLGWTPIVAEFVCADHRYYADTESSVRVPIVVSSPGGWHWPLHWPVSVTAPVSTVTTVANLGRRSTWATTTFYGPVNSPSVELLDIKGGVLWKAALNGTLAYDQAVTIDPHPWARTALRTDAANWAGKLSRDSARMQDMLIPPGVWQVRFTGTDQTGTAACEIRLRDAWASL